MDKYTDQKRVTGIIAIQGSIQDAVEGHIVGVPVAQDSSVEDRREVLVID